jgi:hypothetical protein
MKYIGNGSFVVGMPARDLTADEVKQFGRQKLLDTNLYQDPDAKQDTLPEKTEEKAAVPASKNKEN